MILSYALMHNFKFTLFISLIITAFTYNASSQTFNKEINLTSENDSYMMNGRDGYYTNGLEFEFKWSGKNSKIHNIKAGQNLYNSEFGDYEYIESLDRPITAYSHITYKQTSIINDNNLLIWSGSLAAIGSMALGKETQKFIHNIFGMYKPSEWKYQLKNSIGVNGNISWVHTFPVSHKFEIQSITKARAGFFFNNIEFGPLFRIGKFNKNTNSSLWGTKINDTDSKNELFFYFYPTLSVYAFNATIEGGIFNDKEKFTSTTNTFLYHHQIGGIGTFNRFTIRLAANYTTKEAESQRRDEWYGTIGLGYLFR